MTTLGAEWIDEHRLMAYGSKSEFSSMVPLFKEEHLGSDHDSLIMKYIVFESHSLFTEVQESGEKNVQSHSHAYRSLLRAAIQENSQENDDNKKLVALYELIWSFCEVIFVEHLPGGCVLPYLQELMVWHFPQADAMLSVLVGQEVPNQHPMYWDCIITLLFQGRVTETVMLLKAGSDGEIFIPLLEEMPLLQNFSGNSLSDFKISWSLWQDNCKALKDTLELEPETCQDIMGLLCGELDVFIKYKSLAHTWYHLLTSYLLYTAPTLSITSLNTYAKDMVEIFSPNLTALDQILLSVIEFDAHNVITQCVAHFENSWWLVAHLADILHHAGQLDSTFLGYGCSLREYVLLRYASELVFCDELWGLGIDYFKACSTFGKAHLELAIPRIPLKNQRKALRLWSACNKHGLEDLGAGVCRVMSSNLRQNEQLGLALIWSLRAKDYTTVTNISEQLLDKYIETGGFTHLDFLEQLGPTKLCSNRLMFLGKYRELHSLVRAGERKKAADLLVSLVQSNLGPVRFQITLLYDALPLIGASPSDTALSSEKTETLLKALEDMQIQGHVKGDDAQKVSSIRLTLVDNLCSSFLKEPW